MPRHSGEGATAEEKARWVKARKSAELWFKELLAEAESSFGNDTKATRRFWETLRTDIATFLGDEVKKPETEPPKARNRAKIKATNSAFKEAFGSKVENQSDEDWEEALALCSDILDRLDELPEKAEDFGESIREKVESIGETIEEKERVTPNQLSALHNMSNGVDKWLR